MTTLCCPLACQEPACRVTNGRHLHRGCRQCPGLHTVLRYHSHTCHCVLLQWTTHEGWLGVSVTAGEHTPAENRTPLFYHLSLSLSQYPGPHQVHWQFQNLSRLHWRCWGYLQGGHEGKIDRGQPPGPKKCTQIFTTLQKHLTFILHPFETFLATHQMSNPVFHLSQKQ